MANTTFLGHKVSDYGIENGRVDYLTLSKVFDCILANNLYEATGGYETWELINSPELEEDTEEIYQWYVISGFGAETLQHYTNELIFYNEELNLYLWGVTHIGTSWDYVLTEIEI